MIALKSLRQKKQCLILSIDARSAAALQKVDDFDVCCALQVAVFGVLPIRRIPILGLGLGFGDSGYGDAEFGELKFGEMELGEKKRNNVFRGSCNIEHQTTNRRCQQLAYYLLRATAYMLSAHMLSQFRPSVRLSVCHTGDSCKNG